MSKKRKTKAPKKSNKLKHRLKAYIKKVFDQNPEIQQNYKQISAQLDIKDAHTRKLVLTALYELKDEGYLHEFSRGNFCVNLIHTAEIIGEIDITSRGAGFVIVEGLENDIYIAPENTNRALHGDRVKVSITKEGKKRTEGKITDVIERKTTQFVGTIEMHQRFAFVVTDNNRINVDLYVTKEKLNGAKDGDKVLAKLSSWPASAESPYGEIVEVLGKPGSNDTEMMAILLGNDLEIKFPQEVIKQAEGVGMSLDEEEIKTRRDMRNVTTFTIDPFDAKDFDDALSIQTLENGNYEIGIHIADVSHYVTPDSAMDKEALKRSNSVYLVDRVIPMLPEQLSNLACSLRPNEDKYTFSAVFEIDEKGKIYKEWFGKTATHSDRRFTYEEAQEIIEGAEGDFKDEILILDKIAKLYRKKRLANGALNIESDEIRFKLNEKGEPVEVVHKVAKDSNKLVEEFMLLANKKVALRIGKKNKGQQIQPSVYRVHDKPDLSKLEMFRTFIDKFGYEIDFTHPDQISTAINKLLKDVRLKNEFSLIQTMAIRSMSKAEYSTTNIGHYGLSFEYYTHFTSPIRRYADLMVHRILFEELHQTNHKYSGVLDEICKRISRNERKAIEAERDSNKYFQVQFVKDKVGEIYEGTVSGLADFGMFVKMDENQCEGMITIASLPNDRFSFDQEKFCIRGAKTKKEYNFGDKVRVQIVAVNPKKRQIDLEIFEF